jgi:hypothetical protein
MQGCNSGVRPDIDINDELELTECLIEHSSSLEKSSQSVSMPGTLKICSGYSLLSRRTVQQKVSRVPGIGIFYTANM